MLTRNSDNNNRDSNNQDIHEFLALHSTIHLRMIRKIGHESEEQNKEQNTGGSVNYN